MTPHTRGMSAWQHSDLCQMIMSEKRLVQRLRKTPYNRRNRIDSELSTTVSYRVGIIEPDPRQNLLVTLPLSPD
jgi:hypothetical protein